MFDRFTVSGLFMAFFAFAGAAAAQTPGAAKAPPLSDETQVCIDCHVQVSPGIVEDWRKSKHAKTTVADAMKVPVLSRAVSSKTVPDALMNVAVGCFECHGLNPEKHKDHFEHFEIGINVVVTPPDCAVCHAVEAEEFAGSKKAMAHVNLAKNPVFDALVNATVGTRTLHEGRLVHEVPSAAVKNDTCFGCHGSEVTVKGMKTVTGLNGQKAEVPDLDGWPNQGAGRLNPDGSRGACSACHTRHEFSIETARKPHTCSQCHKAPDLPAYEVWSESKHGNLYFSQGDSWNFSHVPWQPGKDFAAPTCATCHMSLLAKEDDKTHELTALVPRTHDLGSRLWVRIFGLPYSHPQPKSGDTTTIKNADGQPLPTTFGGVPAAEHLIDAAEQTKRKDLMGQVCRSCHTSDVIDGHFEKLDRTIVETDRMVRTATALMERIWAAGGADRKNFFDEEAEMRWTDAWLKYANSIRYASAMGGPNYASFENGWVALNAVVLELDRLARAAEKK